jgi:hypothetical protein
LRDEKTAKKLVDYIFQGRQQTMASHLSRKKSKKGLKVSK